MYRSYFFSGPVYPASSLGRMLAGIISLGQFLFSRLHSTLVKGLMFYRGCAYMQARGSGSAPHVTGLQCMVSNRPLARFNGLAPYGRSQGPGGKMLDNRLGSASR